MRFAHFSNSRSWVTPRSSVMGSNFHVLGLTRDVLGSPPSRWVTASVDRLSALTLLTPATVLASHFTRNFMFLYGSKRCVFTGNWLLSATTDPSLSVWARFVRWRPPAGG